MKRDVDVLFWTCLQAEALDPAAAARIWEGQLAGALLAEDGGLALSHLATTAAHGFMRVAAPSIPGGPPRHNLRHQWLSQHCTHACTVSRLIGQSSQARRACKLLQVQCKQTLASHAFG